MKKSESLFGVVRIPMDSLAVSSALLLSYHFRTANMDLIPRVQLLDPAMTLPSVDLYIRGFLLPSVAVFVLIAAMLRLYALRSTWSAWNEIGRIIIASLLWIVVVMGWFFLVKKQLFYSRILLLHGAFFIMLFTSIGRMSVALVQRSLLRIGIGVHQVVSVGRQSIVMSVKIPLERDPRYHYLGHCLHYFDLQKLLQEKHIDLVLQTDPSPSEDETQALINYCRNHHLQYAFLPPVLADVPHMLHIGRIGLVPVIEFQPTPLDGWGRVYKRCFDIVLSLIALLFLSPLLLVVVLSIFFFDGWPVFYVSKRVGERGSTRISMLKFRTMMRNAEGHKETLERLSHRRDGPLFKVRNDPRITPLGCVLRRWSIDELPQLLNVLCGQMSLVGPRPHLLDEVSRYKEEQRRVFAVKPGITGLAQISGRSELHFEEEVRLDVRYIEEWSMALDLWILWRTFFVILARRGAD